jgi:excisionase family DNA binding protein
MLSAERKLTGSHLERLAVVYLRQSSPTQVRLNTRSTERQYGLADEAARLGWERERIVVVDGDLGISGRDAHLREGYKEMVGRVCLGEVGAIFGLEVSRLGRNNAEHHRLLEFCGLTDTLIVDSDGIYDLHDFNDRLVLGLKAQMSEAELHIIASRMQGAKRAAAERGELRFPLPVGYLYDEDGQIVIDPDEEVQAAITDLFRAFEQTGSAYGVVGAFKGRRFPKRAYGGAWAGELRWGAVTHRRVLGVLRNPCYAGAYVFGRYRSRRVVRPDGTIVTKTSELPRSDWAVLIHAHHPAYITWEAYLHNEQRLAANDTRGGQRPAREGRALCQGIVRCGACGRSMSTQYQAEGAHYNCAHSRADHIQTAACRSVVARIVDELVARRLLEALAPEEIALALAAADEVAERRVRSSRALELRVERARYEAARAERAFHQCDPDNRLVARSLERRWEEKLRELKDAEACLAEQAAPAAPEPSREQIEALARDLPALWTANSTSEKDRKRLLRALIADITLTSEANSRQVRVGIRWRSGAAEEHTLPRPQTAGEARRTPPDAVTLIKRLGTQRTDAQLADELNAAGLRTGTGLPFDERAVRWVRYAHNIPAPPLLQPDELTVSQVAERLGVSPSMIYDWISNRHLAARRSRGNRLCIPFPPEIEQECRQRAANSAHISSQTQTTTARGAV